MNRLTRDEILIRGLDLLDNPTLDQHDRPSATIVSTAFTIRWLQDGLDYIHHLYPFAGTVKTTTLSLVKDTESYALPSDYILDYKNGITIASEKIRLGRRGLDYIVKRDAATRGLPRVYAIHTPNLIVYPIPDKAYTAKLWYYSLPVVLGAATVPNFPSDYCLVEYVHLRGQEWVNAVPKGTAMSYLKQVVSELQRAGIGSELESDDLGTFDTQSLQQEASDYDSWMGPSAIV